MKQKNIYFYTNILAWSLVLLLVGNYVFGWTTPTANPPEGDLSAPLDISSTAQTKTGDLTIDSLFKVGRYVSAPTGATGALYYDTTENEFKGYTASSWDSLGIDTDTWIATQTCSTDYALQSVGKESKVCINKVDYSDVAYDVSCTNCLTNVEVASADVASDLSCTDCIGTTEIADSYVLNTGDTMTGNLTMATDATVDGVDISDYSSYFIGSAGTSGQVWKSDGVGAGVWGTSTDTDTWITTQTCSTDYALQSVGKESKVCINKVDYSDVAYDVSCTNCLTNVEVASADVASDLSCTDCIGTTEIADSYVLNTGDTMTGALAMGSQKITGLATPTVDTDAATKGYVDAAGGYSVCIASWNTCGSGWTQIDSMNSAGERNPHGRWWCGGGSCVLAYAHGDAGYGNCVTLHGPTGGTTYFLGETNCYYAADLTAYWCCK